MSSEKESDKAKVARLTEELEQKERELSRYRQEIQKTNATLEKLIVDLSRELKMAQKIQKMLAPTEIPSIPGVEFSNKFVPGTESGGDYFDIFELEDKMRFGVVVASCSGYGVSALFLSILIKYSSRIEARKGIAPDLVLDMIAKELVPEIGLRDSASLFYGIFDRRSFELRYSSCGSVGAWLLSSVKSSPVFLEPSAPALTRAFQASFLSSTLSLNPRDRFVVCTDGILAAQNAENVAFGTENFSKTLATAPKSGVHELLNEILLQCERFTGRTEPVRDQTVVVTEVKEKVIRLAKD